MNERSGVVNIGIEGMMLTAAFVGWFVGGRTRQPGRSRPIRRRSSGSRPALLHRRDRGDPRRDAASRLLHAWLSISVRADQIISGTIINIAAFGLTGYLNRLIIQTSPLGAGTFEPFVPRPALVDLPADRLDDQRTFLDQGPIAMSVDRPRHRPAGPAVPNALGPADARRRRAPGPRRRSGSTSSGCATGT